MRRIDNGRRGERKSRESKAERAKFLLTTHVKETKKKEEKKLTRQKNTDSVEKGRKKMYSN